MKIYIIFFVIGVAIATVTEISFDIVGLLSALMATAGFAIITVYSKKALKLGILRSFRKMLFLDWMIWILF